MTEEMGLSLGPDQGEPGGTHLEAKIVDLGSMSALELVDVMTDLEKQGYRYWPGMRVFCRDVQSPEGVPA